MEGALQLEGGSETVDHLMILDFLKLLPSFFSSALTLLFISHMSISKNKILGL